MKKTDLEYLSHPNMHRTLDSAKVLLSYYTNILWPQKYSGKLSHYNFNQLGNCSEFDFKNDSMQGNITTDAAGSDEWNGEWIKLMLNDGVTIIECLIEGYVGGGSMKSVDLNCNPKGRID